MSCKICCTRTLITFEFVQILIIDKYAWSVIDCGEGKKRSEIKPELSRDKRDNIRVKRQDIEMFDRYFVLNSTIRSECELPYPINLK